MIRRRPSAITRRALLRKQHNLCFWCGREFGSIVVSPKHVLHTLNPVWDHYIPYSYTGRSDDRQFVASCRVCNSYKGAFVMTDKESEDDLRAYLKAVWTKKGWKDLLAPLPLSDYSEDNPIEEATKDSDELGYTWEVVTQVDPYSDINEEIYGSDDDDELEESTE